MTDQRTGFRRIRDKFAGRFTRPSAPQASDTAAAPNLPSPNSLSTIPNRLQTLDLSDRRQPSHLQPSFVVENINVVGRDQINNNVTNIHINRDLADETIDKLGLGAERMILADPLFKNLSHVVKASYDASTPALRRACTENTRTAILEAIKEWAFDSTAGKIYWMNGMAGTGKTTISYSVSVMLNRHNILGATFFCSRLVDECTKVDRIFPTIAHNLSRNYPPLASAILEALTNDPDIANRKINQQFTDLLVEPCRRASKDLVGHPIVVVIDALDECANQPDVQTFLSVIFENPSELPFKVFITSRPEQVVRVGFNRQGPDSYSKLVLHDIERDIVNADIKFYVTERLVEMVDGRSDFEESVDDWPPEDKVDVLCRRANRLFIYAKTVCDYIGGHGGNISERLGAAAVSGEESNELPGDTLDTSELDRLYSDILNHAIPKQPKERDRLKRIIAAVVSIRNPLSARGLGTLLGIDPNTIKSALASLHSVISVPQSLGDPVSTFHASFPDYITDPTRSQHHFLPPSASHLELAKRCLSLMNISLKENICSLQGRPANVDIGNDTIAEHVSEGLAYACTYWASHLRASRKDEIRDADDVHEVLDEFIREHVLHWIECLSLLNRLDVATNSLIMMELMKLDIYPEAAALVNDTLRFVLENFELIGHYCLETYHSAFVWLPAQSPIRKHYTTQKPGLPKITIGLRNSYKKVATRGNTVRSVAYSRDGCHIVSGLNDGTVRVWSVVTGESEGIFKGHSSSVETVAFSIDGRQIASGSEDSTVRIWNVVTGDSEGILEGHSSSVLSVAFSRDGSHIASGSDDSTVRVWDALTGRSERVFEGHSSLVDSVAFSWDGRHVVSGSFDGTVRIWNVVTGSPEDVLETHLQPESDEGRSHAVAGSDDTEQKNSSLGHPFVRLSDHTEIECLPNGAFNISTVDSLHPRSFCSVSDDHAWILTSSRERSCWIPNRYRYFCCSNSYGSKIVFGYVSGIIVAFDLSGT